MNILNIRFFNLIVVVTTTVSAQHIDEEPDLNAIIESVFSVQDETVNNEDVYDSFMHLFQQPIDLNKTTRNELQLMYVLTEQEISQILTYRSKAGKFLSIYELYLIEGIDSMKVSLIKPFITVNSYDHIRNDSIPFVKKLWNYSQSSLVLRYSRILEKRRGYKNRQQPGEFLKNRYYIGSPDQIFARFNLQVPNNLNIGLTIEKDAGEPISFIPSKGLFGFDHYSGFIQKQFNSRITHITIGDFQFQTGQGLVMGNGFSVGKGTESIATIKRFDQGLRPYQGATEYGYFRGVALGIGGNKWGLDTFFSRKTEDATVTFEKKNNQQVITGFIQNGYHRTPAEFEKKNMAIVNSIGFRGRFQSRYRNLTIGISGLWNQMNSPILENFNYYNRYDFSGINNYNLGLYYDYFKGKFNVFGEVASSKTGGIGMVQGIIANISSEVETIFQLRYYDKRYYSFFGKAFGEFSVNNNEQGIYWGLKVRPLAHLQVHFFFDIFRSLWLRYSTASPSTGHEWMVYSRYDVGKYSTLDFCYQEEHKEKNLSPVGSYEYSVSSGSRRKAKISYQYKPEIGLILKIRLQGDQFLLINKVSSGLAVVQDLGFQFNWGYIKGRFCYFNTDDYNTRQFVYEHDVLYYYSIPAYFGHGIRYYLLVKVLMFKNLNFWIKFGQYNFFDQKSIGTGLDEINGNKKTEVRCQIRLKF